MLQTVALVFHGQGGGLTNVGGTAFLRQEYRRYPAEPSLRRSREVGPKTFDEK